MKWISIDSELPCASQHGDRFLVYDKYGLAIAEFFDDLCGACNFDGKYRMLNNVTHWMPLPEAP